MSEQIIITVQGTPRSQPRGRAVGENRIVSIVDPRTKAWAASVRSAAQRCMDGLGGPKVTEAILGGKRCPLAMRVIFHIPTKNPKDWGKWHSAASRYDLDNLEKLVMDELMGRKGCPLGSDDARIANKWGIKLWSRPRDAGCYVTLEQAGDPALAVAQMMGRTIDSVKADLTPAPWLIDN